MQFQPFMSVFVCVPLMLLCVGVFCGKGETQKRRRASFYLKCIIASLFLIICRNLFIKFGFLDAHPFMIGWGMYVPYLTFAFIFLFMQSRVSSEFPLQDKTWLHFVPAMIACLLSVVMLTLDPQQKQKWLTALLNKQAIPTDSTFLFYLMPFVCLLSLAQFVFYWWLSGEFLRSLHHKTTTNKSLPDHEECERTLLMLDRIRYGLLAFVVLGFLWLSDGMLDEQINMLFFLRFSTLFFASFLLTIFVQGVLNIEALLEPERASVPEYDPDVIDVELADPSALKYGKSKVDTERLERLADRFKALMNAEKLFLNEELSFDEVALRLDCSKHHLSQAINCVLGKSFNDLVSEMRVEEAKRILLDEPQMNMLNISMAAGFKSKSGFYKAFKKYTQTTPTAFKTQINVLN